MTKKKSKKSVADKILELGGFLKKAHTAREIKRELKDTRGHSVDSKALMMALIGLLRDDKIKRKKEGKVYRYYT